MFKLSYSNPLKHLDLDSYLDRRGIYKCIRNTQYLMYYIISLLVNRPTIKEINNILSIIISCFQ